MFALLLLFGFNGFASATASEVKIDSFFYTDSTQGRTAELCGTVTPAPGAVMHVTVTVDPKSKRPALYIVPTNSNGKFCSIVMTMTGTASAEATGVLPAAVVKAQVLK